MKREDSEAGGIRQWYADSLPVSRSLVRIVLMALAFGVVLFGFNYCASHLVKAKRPQQPPKTEQVVPERGTSRQR